MNFLKSTSAQQWAESPRDSSLEPIISILLKSLTFQQGSKEFFYLQHRSRKNNQKPHNEPCLLVAPLQYISSHGIQGFFTYQYKKATRTKYITTKTTKYTRGGRRAISNFWTTNSNNNSNGKFIKNTKGKNIYLPYPFETWNLPNFNWFLDFFISTRALPKFFASLLKHSSGGFSIPILIHGSTAVFFVICFFLFSPFCFSPADLIFISIL